MTSYGKTQTNISANPTIIVTDFATAQCVCVCVCVCECVCVFSGIERWHVQANDVVGGQ